MSTRGSGTGGGSGVTLPDAVPVECSPLTRLHWELGHRVVSDEESTRVGEWEHTDRWALTAFRVTRRTVLLRVRTPVGRTRFYGAELAALDAIQSSLDAAASWRRTV